MRRVVVTQEVKNYRVTVVPGGQIRVVRSIPRVGIPMQQSLKQVLEIGDRDMVSMAYPITVDTLALQLQNRSSYLSLTNESLSNDLELIVTLGGGTVTEGVEYKVYNGSDYIVSLVPDTGITLLADNLIIPKNHVAIIKLVQLSVMPSPINENTFSVTYQSSGYSNSNYIQYISGPSVDNSDPLNPVVNPFTLQQITDQEALTTNDVTVNTLLQPVQPSVELPPSGSVRYVTQGDRVVFIWSDGSKAEFWKNGQFGNGTINLGLPRISGQAVVKKMPYPISTGDYTIVNEDTDRVIICNTPANLIFTFNSLSIGRDFDIYVPSSAFGTVTLTYTGAIVAGSSSSPITLEKGYSYKLTRLSTYYQLIRQPEAGIKFLTSADIANKADLVSGKVPQSQSQGAPMSYNSETGIITYFDPRGDEYTIDLPIENLFQDVSYNSSTQILKLATASGHVTEIPLSDLVDLPEIKLATGVPTTNPTTGQKLYLNTTTGNYWIALAGAWTGPFLGINQAQADAWNAKESTENKKYISGNESSEEVYPHAKAVVAYVESLGFITGVSNADTTTFGVSKLYNSLGTNEDGGINQKVVTDNFALKEDLAVDSTGSVIQFDKKRIYNSATTAVNTNITNNLTGAKRGIVQKIYHNHTTEPTYPGGWVKLGGTYTNSVLNIIFAEWVEGSRVEYWIVKG